MMMSQAVGVGKEKLSRMQPVPWLLCMTLALGIVMGSVYLVGRNGKTEQAARTKTSMEPLVIPTVEASSKDAPPATPALRPQVVEPVASVPTTAAAAAPQQTVAVPAPAPKPTVAAPVAVPPVPAQKPSAVVSAPAGLAPGVMTDQEARGLLFLQVGAVDATLGRAFAQKIAALGFQVRLAAGPDAKVLRVLVGPLGAPDVAAVKGRLQTAGYTSFPRQY